MKYTHFQNHSHSSRHIKNTIPIPYLSHLTCQSSVTTDNRSDGNSFCSYRKSSCSASLKWPAPQGRLGNANAPRIKQIGAKTSDIWCKSVGRSNHALFWKKWLWPRFLKTAVTWSVPFFHWLLATLRQLYVLSHLKTAEAPSYSILLRTTGSFLK